MPAFLIGRQEFHIDCKFVFIQHCPPPACLYNTAHHLRIVYTTRPTTCVFIQHCPPPACLYNTAHHLRVYTTLPTTCVCIQHCPPPACLSNTAHHLRVLQVLTISGRTIRKEAQASPEAAAEAEAAIDTFLKTVRAFGCVGGTVIGRCYSTGCKCLC